VTFSTLAVAVGTALEIAVPARVMLRPHREPAAHIAWLAVVRALPLIGALAPTG
jgi:cardiolipin synthase